MARIFLLYVLIFFNMGIFAKFSLAGSDLKDMTSLEELPNCDYMALDNKLEALKSSSDVLALRVGLIQYQLDRQQSHWQALDQKLDIIALNLQTIETKLSKERNDQLNEVKDSLNQQYQTIVSRLPAPVGEADSDATRELMLDIKETLKTHKVCFTTFEEKLKYIESVVNKTNKANDTENLEKGISKNFQILEKIEQKLSGMESVAATKDNQIAIKRDLQDYLKQNESTKMCFASEEQQLVCTPAAYPTNCAEFNEKLCSNSNTCYIYNQQFGLKPFLVSCDNKSIGGGWTVIQRRMDGSVNFYRDWSDYKTGFGDISGEFFIGLDKLHALTAALKPVELLIQLRDFNGTTEYAIYDEFEIGNGMENYKLKMLGNHSGNARDCLKQQRGQKFTTKDRDNDEYEKKNCAQALYGAWWYDNCSYSNLNGKYYKTHKTDESNGISWCKREPLGYKYSLKFTQMAIRPKRL